MKIALCLSGQPRNIEIGFNKLKNSILDNNDVDVFVHTWYDPDNLSTRSVIPGRENNTVSLDADKKILDLYQPKSHRIEKPKNGRIINSILLIDVLRIVGLGVKSVVWKKPKNT
jgi:hypothetical protein